MIKKRTLITVLLFAPILFYPPFLFDQVIYAPLRIALFVQLILYLFYKSKQGVISSTDILYLLFFIGYSTLMLAAPIHSFQSLRTIANHALVILFVWGLTRFLKGSKEYTTNILQLYIGFIYLSVGLAVASLIYYLTIGEFDIIGLKNTEAPYKVTPFGIIFTKSFDSINVLRACSYFNEPIYAGIFYAANQGILIPLIGSRAKKLSVINAIGGILTFSTSFYTLMIVLYIIRKFQATGLKAIIGSSIIISLAFVFFIVENLGFTSASERIDRILEFYELTVNSDLSLFLFGHGIGAPLELSKGISAGLFIWISEVGILGALAISLFFCHQHSTPLKIALFFSLSLIINHMTMPLYWLIFVATTFVPNSPADSRNGIYQRKYSVNC